MESRGFAQSFAEPEMGKEVESEVSTNKMTG